MQPHGELISFRLPFLIEVLEGILIGPTVVLYHFPGEKTKKNCSCTKIPIQITSSIWTTPMGRGGVGTFVSCSTDT